ncbi:MAG: hypothetical protein QXG61_00715 [Candidatus Nezhaarchaeales archaeon]
MDYVVVASRHRFAKNRSIKIMDENGNVEHVVPVPDGVVLCDVCGNLIDTSMIMLLVLDGYVWGIICEECRRKYHHDKQLLLWSEYEEAMIRIGEEP